MVLDEIGRSAGVYLLLDKDYSNIHEVKKLEFPKLDKTVPFYEVKWQFDGESTPGMTTLNHSQDISKMDKNKLHNDVFAKYSQLRNLLYSGDIDQFMQEISKAKNDLFIADGVSEEEQKRYNKNLKNYLSSHRNLLPDIDGFRVKILGHGRAVTLERISQGKGAGGLSAKDKKEGLLYVTDIVLHKPKGSDSFEVFRFGSAFAELN
ncbi:TPA: hypothetical protein ACOVFI_004292 [Citrobacter braakii]